MVGESRPALLILGLALICATAALGGGAEDVKGGGDQGTGQDFAVAGYLPEWRYKGVDYDSLCKHMTHLIFFSIEVAQDGSLAAMDRFPLRPQLIAAREAAAKYGTKLLICFGGNSRTNGFPQMVSSKKTRRVFIDNLIKLLEKHSMHGVDYNWEYPRDEMDWKGLSLLLKETSEEFRKRGWVVTMAYYPDTHQEKMMSKYKMELHCDLMHMMSYDQHGKHSTWEFGVQSVERGLAKLPAHVLTMGLPFYSRSVKDGDWKTYEELVKTFPKKMKKKTDQIGEHYFNGVRTTIKKTKYAMSQGLGGVMIWEVGQDVHQTHKLSLLAAISRARGLSLEEGESGEKSESEGGSKDTKAEL